MKGGKVNVDAGDYVVPNEKWDKIEILMQQIIRIIESCPIKKD